MIILLWGQDDIRIRNRLTGQIRDIQGNLYNLQVSVIFVPRNLILLVKPYNIIIEL